MLDLDELIIDLLGEGGPGRTHHDDAKTCDDDEEQNGEGDHQTCSNRHCSPFVRRTYPTPRTVLTSSPPSGPSFLRR